MQNWVPCLYHAKQQILNQICIQQVRICDLYILESSSHTKGGWQYLSFTCCNALGLFSMESLQGSNKMDQENLLSAFLHFSRFYCQAY